MNCRFWCLLIIAVNLATWASPTPGQEAKAKTQARTPPAPIVSPEVKGDRTITFRVRAAKAETVRLEAGDVPNLGEAAALKKSGEGVWETTVGPVPAGAYRYRFNVDGVSVIDPSNPATSESNNNTWSLAVVPGSDLFDTKDVPHGAVAEVTYPSKTLKRPRRMHVYTPPGYAKGDGKFPVFYLLHGASDSDASWSTVGRAGFILDNLIASGKAKPMIVVMPHGHVNRAGFGAPGDMNRQMDEFGEDFSKDLKPYIEENYRVLDGRANRAIAGLSMGGAQTLNVAFDHPEDYGYVGVYSSGIFGIAGPRRPGAFQTPRWEEQHKEALDDAKTKKGLSLVWFATGKDDFLIETTRGTVKMLQGHGFDVTSKETAGGHTWLNWRDYLAEFAPMLFQK